MILFACLLVLNSPRLPSFLFLLFQKFQESLLVGYEFLKKLKFFSLLPKSSKNLACSKPKFFKNSFVPCFKFFKNTCLFAPKNFLPCSKILKHTSLTKFHQHTNLVFFNVKNVRNQVLHFFDFSCP